MELKDSIRQRRRARGMTQEQLAEAMNVSAAAVSKWENGQSTPDITMLAALADYFEVSIDALVDYQLRSRRREEMVERFQALAMSRQYDEAVAMAQDALRRYPNHFDVVNGCARALYSRGIQEGSESDLRSAIELLDRALTLMDQDSAKDIHREDLISVKGMCYSALKDYDAAIACYEAANISGISLVNLGNCRMAQKEYDKALSLFSEGLIDHVIGVVSAAMGIVNCLSSKGGRLGEALALSGWCIHMLDGLESGRGSIIWQLKAVLLTSRAILYAMDGREEQAEQSLREAVAAARAFDAEPRYDLASVRYYYGKSDSVFVDNIGETAMKGIRRLLLEDENAPYTAKLLKALDEMEADTHDQA